MSGVENAAWFISLAYSPGLLVALAVLIILIFLIYVKECIEVLSYARTYRIICPDQCKTLDQYGDLFKAYDMKVVRSVQHKTEHRISGRWILIGSAENHKKLTAYLLNDSNIQELSF